MGWRPRAWDYFGRPRLSPTGVVHNNQSRGASRVSYSNQDEQKRKINPLFHEELDGKPFLMLPRISQKKFSDQTFGLDGKSQPES